MNSRLILLVAALVLAIAAMIHLKRTAASLAPSVELEATDSSVPSKIERIDDDHHPDRLLGLDPSLHQIAIRLEELNLSWERNRTPENDHRAWEDWHEFALKQADKLETHQIKALLNWVQSPENADYITEVWQYRQAFYKSWASREPMAAREHVIALAEFYNVLSPEDKKQLSNPYLDDIADMYHFAIAGSAIHNAPQAWQTFLQDRDNPAIRNLPNTNITTQEIFKAYADQTPSEAWQLVLTETDQKLVPRMLEGFADGAPAGQDWNARATEFIQSLESRGMEARSWVYEDIAVRWITEDPVIALDWFASHHPELRNDAQDPFAPDQPIPDDHPRSKELRQELKIQLLEDMHASPRDRNGEVVTALGQLLQNGDIPLVTAAISELTNDGDLAPWDTPLLELISKIPDRPTRHEIFLKMAKGVRPRGHLDPFAPSSARDFGEPNVAYEAVRDLAHRLDLSPDIRAQADAAFAELERQEEINRAKMQKAQANDPFAE